MFISHERKSDIKKRGKDCLVYDLDNKTVNLCEAKVWYDDNGDYFYPNEVSLICYVCSFF